MKKEVIWVIVLQIIIASLQMYYIYLKSESVDDGRNYSDIMDRATILRKENSLLKEQVLTEESLITIDRKAREQGFVHANYIYLGR